MRYYQRSLESSELGLSMTQKTTKNTPFCTWKIHLRHHWSCTFRVPHRRRLWFTEMRLWPSTEASMKEIQEHGSGAIVYLKQEGRGIGLYAKMQAYALQTRPRHLGCKLTTGPTSRCKNLRNCGKNAQVDRLRRTFLMTNNPEKRLQLIKMESMSRTESRF